MSILMFAQADRIELEDDSSGDSDMEDDEDEQQQEQEAAALLAEAGKQDKKDKGKGKEDKPRPSNMLAVGAIVLGVVRQLGRRHMERADPDYEPEGEEGGGDHGTHTQGNILHINQ